MNTLDEFVCNCYNIEDMVLYSKSQFACYRFIYITIVSSLMVRFAVHYTSINIMNLYHSKREKIDKNQSEIWTTTAWSVAIGIFPDQLLHAAVISKVSVENSNSPPYCMKS